MPGVLVASRLAGRNARAAAALLAAILLLAARPAAGAELSYRAISMNWPQIILAAGTEVHNARLIRMR